MYKKGFTLTEVLITLGVIGVIAAMTLPVLIQKQQKRATEVKLQKFYSVMNNALTRYYADEGIMPENFVFPDEIVLPNYIKYEQWFKDTLGKYINSIKSGRNSYFYMVLSDGSGFYSYVNSINEAFFFYCTDFKYCGVEKADGKNSFLFKIKNGKFMTFSSEISDRKTLKAKCAENKKLRHYCSRLIEFDGWKIKDDYPAW